MTRQEKNTPVRPIFDKMNEQERKHAPVAVMDSGAGGVAVLREICRLLPRENLLYFGDSANAPYGERSPEEARALVLEHAERLLGGAKALVLACNTATALAVNELRRAYPGVPIIGMEPAIKPALSVAECPRVLVLATPITLRGRGFATLLQRYAAQATVVPIALTDLVRLVEAGQEQSPAVTDHLRGILGPYLDPAPDAVVLGCTHFSFVASAIRQVVGREVPIFDGAIGTARQLARRLAACELINPTPARGTVTLTSSKSGVLPLYARLLFDGE